MTADGIVLAVDGGNVKTDLTLVDTGGRLLALVRGGQSSPHFVGTDGCVELLEGLLAQAFSEAGREPRVGGLGTDHGGRCRPPRGARGAARRN